MRNRHFARRCVAAFLAFWFVASTQEIAATHLCPMHDAMAMQMAGQMAPPAASGHAPGPHSAHHQCTCMGAACATGPVPLAAGRITLHEATTIACAAHPSHTVGSVPFNPQYRLPYAHAPPHASVA
ncbi:MAG: hypothetical protein ACREOJ_08850 [Gemmatimonadaceae bacterium]